MTRAQAIAPHLPFLRRYARALTGAQESGDAYVRACLEALIADSAALSEDLPPRVGLYRLFHAVWNGTASLEGDGAATIERSVQSRLKALVPERRQALLLTALEGFSAAEAGQVMDKPADDIRALVNAAFVDIARDISTDVLIIEDEPVIALDLAGIAKDLGHNILGIAATRDEAVAAARANRPGLVLADIQLADDSSGIEAVKDILGDGAVPVIFITAYPERLLTGERPEPTFLITKPFMADTVKAAISQALFFNTGERAKVA